MKVKVWARVGCTVYLDIPDEVCVAYKLHPDTEEGNLYDFIEQELKKYVETNIKEADGETYIPKNDVSIKLSGKYLENPEIGVTINRKEE